MRRMGDNRSNVLIIGAGEVGTALLILLSGSGTVNIVGIAENDRRAPGVDLAREKNIPVETDYRVFLRKGNIDKIIDTTASTQVRDELLRSKPEKTEFVNVSKGSFLWSVINESIKAQERLYESEDKYRQLFDNAADLIAVVDTTVRFIDMNKKFTEESEYTKEEMLGKNVMTSGIVTPPSAAKIGLHLPQILLGHSVPIFEVDGVKKSGGIVNYELKAVPIKRDGKIVGVQAILRNITERKEIEEKLRQSEITYRTIFENSGTAMLIVEEDMTVTMVNAEFARFSGYSKEDTEGRKNLLNFVHEQDLDKMKEFHWLRSVDPHTAPKNYETRFVAKSSMVSEVVLTAAAIPGTKRMVVAIQDITELKRSTYQLSKQKELLDNANKALEHKLEELQEAMGHIKRLEGLVPICANCKKLRVSGKDPNDPGAWVSIEKYFSAKTDASFTHGLCPECIKKLYGKQLGRDK